MIEQDADTEIGLHRIVIITGSSNSVQYSLSVPFPCSHDDQIDRSDMTHSGVKGKSSHQSTCCPNGSMLLPMLVIKHSVMSILWILYMVWIKIGSKSPLSLQNTSEFLYVVLCGNDQARKRSRRPFYMYSVVTMESDDMTGPHTPSIFRGGLPIFNLRYSYDAHLCRQKYRAYQVP
ncbi:hypothetical protein BDB01DRAFT_900148 [Pilobolus umbonatus]|nr:hypothetical protein BDB01DRAFT_900148 [Pilobolus umbonatus]